MNPSLVLWFRRTIVMARRNFAESRRWRRTALGLLCLPLAAQALTPLSDAGLSQVAARDGITLTASNPDGISAGQYLWETDRGTGDFGDCTDGVANRNGCTLYQNLQLLPS